MHAQAYCSEWALSFAYCIKHGTLQCTKFNISVQIRYQNSKYGGINNATIGNSVQECIMPRQHLLWVGVSIAYCSSCAGDWLGLETILLFAAQAPYPWPAAPQELLSTTLAPLLNHQAATKASSSGDLHDTKNRTVYQPCANPHKTLQKTL